MRVVHTVIAALLAVAIGVFPVVASARGTAVQGIGGHHTASGSLDVVKDVLGSPKDPALEHSHEAAAHETTPDVTGTKASVSHCSDDKQGTNSLLCCQMACQLAMAGCAPRAALERQGRRAPVAILRDQQVVSAPRSPIERPPRVHRLA